MTGNLQREITNAGFLGSAGKLLQLPLIGLRKFGVLLSGLTNPILTAVIFLAVFLPIGIILKLFKKDLLRFRFDRDAQSYWIDKDQSAQNQLDLKNQF